MSRARNGRIWALVRAVVLLGLQAGYSSRPVEHERAPIRATAAVLDTVFTEERIDCAIVAAALDSLYGEPNTRLLLLRDSASAQFTTDSAGEFRRIDVVLASARGRGWRDSLGLDRSTIADFARRNSTPGLACSAPPSRYNVWILHQGDPISVKGSIDASRPTRFDPAYPGIIFVSRAGLSADRRQALLTVSNICGGLCGAGFVVVLHRDGDGRWRITRAEELWVS